MDDTFHFFSYTDNVLPLNLKHNLLTFRLTYYSFLVRHDILRPMTSDDVIYCIYLLFMSLLRVRLLLRAI